MTADASVAVPVINGIAVHICHTDAGDGGTGAPMPHDCCDACALCAALTLPGSLDLTAPARVIHHVRHAAALDWAPAIARPRTPRQAQGPPGA